MGDKNVLIWYRFPMLVMIYQFHENMIDGEFWWPKMVIQVIQCKYVGYLDIYGQLINSIWINTVRNLDNHFDNFNMRK